MIVEDDRPCADAMTKHATSVHDTERINFFVELDDVLIIDISESHAEEDAII